MPDNMQHVTKTLEDLRDQLRAKIEEARRLIGAMNMLETMLGMRATELTQLVPSDADGANGLSHKASPLSVRPDEYMGMEPLEAAKKHIGAVGHALHMDDICEAISKGGAATRGTDWREKLETSLTRSVYEVVKVQDKTFGLISFYSQDQIDRLRGARGRSSEPKGKAGRKAGRRHRRKPSTASTRKTANVQGKRASESPKAKQERKRVRPEENHKAAEPGA